jgi:hypothetical protein
MKNVTSMLADNYKWLANGSNVKMGTVRHRHRHRRRQAVIQAARPVHQDRIRPLVNKERERREKEEMEENVVHVNKVQPDLQDHPVQMAKMAVMVKQAMPAEMEKMELVHLRMEEVVEDVQLVILPQDPLVHQEPKVPKDHLEIPDRMRHHHNQVLQVQQARLVPQALEERMAIKARLAMLENLLKHQANLVRVVHLVNQAHPVNPGRQVNQAAEAMAQLQLARLATLAVLVLQAKLAVKDHKDLKVRRAALVHALHARLQERLPDISCFEAVFRHDINILHQSVMV